MMAFRARPVLAVAGSMLCVAATVGASAAPAQASASASAPGWRITKILNPKYDSNLLNVIAPSTHDTWAFGDGAGGRPIGAHWTGGTAWPNSAIPGAFTRVGYVSSTSPDNVWAGGSECSGGGPGIKSVTATYVARFNGHKWSSTRFNTAAYCGGSMVTTSPSNGWLLGTNQAEHFTGRHWTKVSLPKLGSVISATAVSAHDIWAAGGRFNALHLARSTAFFTHYNGHVWRTVGFPAIKLPKNGYLYPYDIAAASANNIWAAVTVFPAGAQSFLLHWNGSKWQKIPLPVTPYQLLQLTPDGHGGVWAIMFQSQNGDYQFAHYAAGHWTYDQIPTNGLPSGVTPTSASFDVYSIALIPGTRDVVGSGDVFYTGTNNVSHEESLIFQYTP
jgi:hypothetical protein